MGTLIEDLAASPALVDEAVAKSNASRVASAEPLRDQQADLRDRLRKVDRKIDNLVEVLATQGASALASIEGKLREAERDKVIAAAELAEVSETLRNLTRKNVNQERVRAVLGDFRLLYDLATGKERGELIRLLFRRIEFNGPDENIEVELWDQTSQSLEPRDGGSRQWTIQLPKRVSNKNFETCIVIDIGAARKRRDSKRKRRVRTPRILEVLDLADEFQEALDTGMVNNRAALARLHGISRARVTQVMALLRLHPDLVSFVRAARGLGVRTPSERRLRPLPRQPMEAQPIAATKLFPELGSFLAALPKLVGHTG